MTEQTNKAEKAKRGGANGFLGSIDVGKLKAQVQNNDLEKQVVEQARAANTILAIPKNLIDRVRL